jgi:hypothetical protein
MAHNKFLSFGNESTSTNSSSTFVIEAASKTLSIDVKETDEIITLPNPSTTEYDKIQYRKTIQTRRDISFQYKSLQKGRIYHHRVQTIIFHKFKPLNSSELNWIC